MGKDKIFRGCDEVLAVFEWQSLALDQLKDSHGLGTPPYRAK